MGILRQSAKLRSQMFSRPPGNLFSIFMNVVITSSFLVSGPTCNLYDT